MTVHDDLATLPQVGEIVIVKTHHHSGERALVTKVDWQGRPRTHGGYVRRFFWLEGIEGSLRGAEGWYEPHEVERTSQSFGTQEVIAGVPA